MMNSFGLLNFWAFGATTQRPLRKGWGNFNLLSRIDKKINFARYGISAVRFFASLRFTQNDKNLVRFLAPQNFAKNNKNLLEFFTPQNFSKNNANPQISSTFKFKIQRKAQISSISKTQIPYES